MCNTPPPPPHTHTHTHTPYYTTLHNYLVTVVSDIGKVGQLHFAAMQRMIQEGSIKLPSPSPSLSSSQPSQSASRHSAREKGPASLTRTAADVNPVLTSGTKIVPSLPSSVPPHQPSHPVPQPSYPIARGNPGVQQRPTFTPVQYGAGVTSTPAQFSGGVSSAPYTPPQPQPTIPQTHEHATSTAQTGGQFYSRRMAGSYNY